MQNIYRLEINSYNEEFINSIESILKAHLFHFENWYIEISKWSEEVNFKIVDNGIIFFDYISFFLNIIESHSNEFKKNGVERKDISIWRLYEYDEQCNMEYSAEELKKLWDAGVTFCISCWEWWT